MKISAILCSVLALGLAVSLRANPDLIPAGTALSVRVNQTIDSKTSDPGAIYPAIIYRDVVDDNGDVVIPRDSPAQLTVRDIHTKGPVGSRELVLDLDSVTVNGRTYNVNAESYEKSSHSGIGKNKRTGEMVGGGAILGTIIGAIAGGGKGAAIGALAGAGAGGTAQVLTRGHTVRVPAETILTFRLDQPLRIR